MSDPLELNEKTPVHSNKVLTKAQFAYLESLNDGQQTSVQTTAGPVQVLAGAGTGKTRVLTTRLAYILDSGLASPGEMLAVTFTNKAAREMKNRVSTLLHQPLEGWWLGTFHAIAARILRSNAEVIGLKNTFTILDTDDQVRLIKQFTEIHNIDDKRVPARAIAGIIQRWKDRGLLPEQVSEAEGGGQLDGRVLALYEDYQKRLKEVNAADFGDLILHCLTLFTDNPSIANRYQQRFRYIMVDEYQDTNVAQYLWLRILAQKHQNICCVGDDDQSIYSWRGAEVGNILRFEKDFPGATVVRLEQNYRSTPHILAAASGLIEHNEGRLGKTLWTDIDGGEKVQIVGFWDGEQEAFGVGEEIEQLEKQSVNLNEIAILVRASFQTREFEERFITLGIPYRVIGGARFYERQEIRDAIAFLRVIFQPDDDLAFERIVNVPKRGLGPGTLQVAHFYARKKSISLTSAVTELLETDEFRPLAQKSFSNLLADFTRWRNLQQTMPPNELTGLVLDESGYSEMWKIRNDPDAPGRLDNLKELVVALEEFQTLGDFLEHVSLVMENEEANEQHKVNIMTLHGAKGLEFECVFLPGWEDGLFPHQRALDEGGLAALEEERRLAYVGLTRARIRAYICLSANRRVYGQWQSTVPSRFLDELPNINVEWNSENGIYHGRTQNRRNTSVLIDDWPTSRRKSRRRDQSKGSYIDKINTTNETLQIGDRIFHQKFGYGCITQIDGDKLEIEFEKAGFKRVKQSFVEYK